MLIIEGEKVLCGQESLGNAGLTKLNGLSATFLRIIQYVSVHCESSRKRAGHTRLPDFFDL